MNRMVPADQIESRRAEANTLPVIELNVRETSDVLLMELVQENNDVD